MNRKEWLDKHFNKIKKLYPSIVGLSVFLNKADGRYLVNLNFGNSKNTCKQYAQKYL